MSNRTQLSGGQPNEVREGRRQESREGEHTEAVRAVPLCVEDLTKRFHQGAL